MRNLIIRLYKIISTILLVSIVGLAVLLVGVRVVGLTPYTVLSGSMEPYYHVGSLIYVKKLPVEQIQVGDAITFVLNEDLVVATHRVVKVDQEEQVFYTKGDANEMADASPVSFKNVLGKATFSIPYLGYFSSFIATDKGKVVGGCVLVVVLLLVFTPDIMHWVDKDSKGKAKEQEVKP